jgi:hypothetical protein
VYAQLNPVRQSKAAQEIQPLDVFKQMFGVCLQLHTVQMIRDELSGLPIRHIPCGA